MKTKGAIVAGAVLLATFLSVSAMAAGAHKKTVNGLIVDTITPGGNSSYTIVGHKNGVTYTVAATSKTKLTRKDGTRAPFTEINELNSLTVWGTTPDGTTITAGKIRDNSLRKQIGFGTIALKAPDNLPFPNGITGAFIMLTNKQTPGEVLVYGNTKFYNGKRRITYADLQPGDVISARGYTDISFTLIDIIYNTTQVKVKRHGAVPNIFPSTLKPQFKYFNR